MVKDNGIVIHTITPVAIKESIRLMYGKVIPGLKQFRKPQRVAEINVLPREAGDLPFDHGRTDLDQVGIGLSGLCDHVTLVIRLCFFEPSDEIVFLRFDKFFEG